MAIEALRTAVERATREDLEPASTALALAFQEDPVASWVIPDPQRRRDTLPLVFELFTGIVLHHDETWVLSDHSGAALWAPAGAPPIPDDAAEDFERRSADIAGPAADRFFELLSLQEQNHPEEPSFYLAFVGVIPERQGQGLGRALLAPVLRRCDETGSSAYLEATSPASRRLYERLDFEAIGEIPLPDGPSLYPMWRTPKSAKET